MKNKKILQLKVIVSILALIIPLFGYAQTRPEGDVWLVLSNQNVGSNENFDVEVHMSTGGKNLGAFNMYFDFYTDNITIDTSQGDNGVDKGVDAGNYMALVNSDDVSNGHLRFGGIAGSGHANDNDVHLATIHVQTTSNFVSGTSDLSLRVNELSDEGGNELNSGSVTGSSITYQGQVYNMSNFTQLNSNWLGAGNIESDVNNDGVTNTRDLGIMMSNWEE